MKSGDFPASNTLAADEMPNFPHQQAVVELVRGTVRCQTAAISIIFGDTHQVLASDGDDLFQLKNFDQLVQQVADTNQILIAGQNTPDDPLYVGLPLRLQDGEVVGVVSMVDTTGYQLTNEHHRAFENMQGVISTLVASHDAHRVAAERQSELHLTLEQMDQGLNVFDADARLVLWNQRYIDIFELDPKTVVKGVSLAELIASKETEDRLIGFTNSYDTMLRELRDGLARGEVVTGGAELRNGRVISSVHTAMPDGGWVATHSDITEQVRAQEKIKHASEHDSMTGLVNRATFSDAFEERMQEDGRLVVMLVDIDHFKAVNDNFGHAAGDAVIISVAQRLKACVRQSDVVARLGGDEFAVLLHLDADAPDDAATAIADKVVERMSRELSFQGTIINYSVSVGLREIAANEADLEEVLSCADFALYKAKEKGRDRHQAFNACIARQLYRSQRMQALVREDTYAQKLKMHYQPIVHVDGGPECAGKDYGFEALIRWAGDASEFMAPIDIIQAAEQNGSIASLGEWVLNAALQESQDWDHRLRIAVNVSPKQLGQGEFVCQVKTALTRWNASPHRLELEVTETALLQDQASIDELHQIKALGVRIALDDFGTGYSSLTLLQRFPFDKLKIDRSFVDKVDTDPLSRAIVSSVAQLGRDLNVRTVAEGIETEQHLSVMASIGCSLGQGYLLGRPMPASDVVKRMAAVEKAA
ncbi:MAG: putative bifunctional diguanylate cyclase/phosphodiesterase [Devosiaceae bacterium]